jgi:hypothetical protein
MGVPYLQIYAEVVTRVVGSLEAIARISQKRNKRVNNTPCKYLLLTSPGSTEKIPW